MRASEQCIAFIKEEEGFRAHAYLDPVGIWTIGYGSTGSVKEGEVWTEAQADRTLRAHVAQIETEIRLLLRTPLTQGQWDALVSLAYNIGIANFRHSTLLKLINQSELTKASFEFPKWCHAGDQVLPGLQQRRLTEQSWFQEKVAA